MALQTVDVGRGESGKLWLRKTPPMSDNGLVLKITHNASSALALHARNVRFLHAAFDVLGNSFVAGDYQGNIFQFDVHKNRFSLVQKVGTACTAIAFALRRKTEFLVGLSDYSLRCYDTDTKELVSWMRDHEAPIHSISVHASGRYTLTSCKDTALLWDLDSFERKRKLNINQNVGIIKVFFLPLSNTIVTCFKDDSIFAWESDTLKCKYQLPTPAGKSPGYRAFAATRDGRLLVAGGKSNFLHVYALDTRRLLRILQLPDSIKAVRQLEFLPDSFDGGANQVLGVLCQDGVMRFINIQSSKQLFDVGGEDNKISNVSVSPNGKHIVAVLDNGDMNLYSVEALYQELNQPPPPLVKVLKSNKMADSTVDSDKPKKKTQPKQTARKANRSTASAESQMEPPYGLNMDKMRTILRGYGEYPVKYRMFIWRSILQLPENHAAYASLVDKGTHPAYENLHEKFPIKSRKLLRVLQRTLSALAHWSPLFGETEYLAMLAFPFVKVFQNNQLICFEIVASILVNWSQHWFEYFPNPPVNILGMVENILAFHDKELLHHFVKYGVTTQVYAWPMLQTLMSEVLTKDEWLKLMDNVLSNHPSFLLMVVAAYCICFRGPLKKCTEVDDFVFFFHHTNALDISQLLKEAYHLMEATPEDIHPQNVLQDAVPLQRGQYPVFNKYPKFIVDYQVQERNRIRKEEQDYLRQRQLSHEMQQERQKRYAEEEAWYRQQKLLLDAEDKRRLLLKDADAKLTDQRNRVQAMNRELKLRELQQLDATRRTFREFQQQRKQAEVLRLEEELKSKRAARDVETQAAVDDAEIRAMELQLQKNVLEQELRREQIDSDLRHQAEVEARSKEAALRNMMAEDRLQADKLKQAQTVQAVQRELAHSDRLLTDLGNKQEVTSKAALDNLDRQQRALETSQLEVENRTLEQRVTDLLQELQEVKTRAAWEEQQGQTKLPPDVSTRLGLLEQQYAQSKQRLNNHNLTGDSRQNNTTTGFDHSSRHHQILNESDTSDLSSHFSLDRGRKGFEEREQQLMAQVIQLRQNLARQNRNNKPPSVYNTDI